MVIDLRLCRSGCELSDGTCLLDAIPVARSLVLKNLFGSQASYFTGRMTSRLRGLKLPGSGGYHEEDDNLLV